MAGAGGNIATPITHQGPFIDVIISAPGPQVPASKVRGLIDTGADFVLFSPSIARSLRLRQVDEVPVGGIGGGSINAKVYSRSLRVPDLGFEKTMPLYAVDWDPTSHTVLLGRSFLKYFVFRYDGPSEVFHFSAPLGGG